MALPDDMKWLCDVEGLDAEDGLKYCGSPKKMLPSQDWEAMESLI